MEEASTGSALRPSPRHWTDAAPHRWLGVAAGACLALVSVWFIARGSFEHEGIRGFTLFDDAMISMRYAYNLATTGVLEWSHSSGRIEGITNLGWTFLMALLIKLTNIQTAPLAVSVVSVLLLVAGIAVLGGRQSKYAAMPTSLRLAALAGSFSLVTWSVRGFETSLLFSLIASLYVLTTSRSFGLAERLGVAGLTSLGVLTRDDFTVFCLIDSAALVMFKLVARRWVWSTWAAPVTLSVSAVAAFMVKAAFRYSYFAEVLPNTYYLKVHGHEKAVILARGLLSLYGNALSVLAPVLLVLLLLFFWSRQSWLASLTWEKELDSHLIVASLLAYSTLVGGDAWEWSGLANRFVCAALPFILLNLIQFTEIYAGSPGAPFPLRRHAAHDVLPIYALLLPAFLGFGHAYQALTAGLSNKVTELAVFSPRSAMQNWLLVGLALLILPAIWQRWRRSAESDPRRGGALLAPCVALLLLTQPVAWIATAEMRAHGNLLHVVDDSGEGLASVSSRRVITSGSKVVSLWAGTFPYYRPDLDFIDPLGKMDATIARSKPRRPFHPGHTKWDWNYTLSRYRPDYVRGDLKALRQEGRWTDKTPEWDHYEQLQTDLIRRKSD